MFNRHQIRPIRSALLPLLVLLLAGASGCATQSTVKENPSYLMVDFSWKDHGRCLDSETPAFSIEGIPPETQSLRFSLRDIYFPFFPHGGGTLDRSAFTTDKTVHISKGQVSAATGHYIGPCAPPFFPGQYRFTVTALDKDGQLLSIGKATRPFPHR